MFSKFALIAAILSLGAGPAFAGQNVHININVGGAVAKAFGGSNFNSSSSYSNSTAKAYGGQGGMGGNGYYSPSYSYPTSNYNNYYNGGWGYYSPSPCCKG